MSKLLGTRVVAALTLFFTIAHNSYNALDTATDGFNLNENYLALPMLLAVFAHLTIGRATWRGLVRGIGIGVALTIKQTAAGLLVVLLLHGLVDTLIRRRYAEGARAAGLTLVGVAACWGPLLLFLHARGWLTTHLHNLASFSGKHVTTAPVHVLTGYELAPVVPLLWWAALGALGWLAVRAYGSRRGDDTSVRRAMPGESRFDAPASGRSAVAFVWLWLCAEAVIVAALNIPATHYYQQLVAPAALVAGFGITALARAVAPLRLTERAAAWRWVGATTGAATLMAAMPLLAEVPRRLNTLDRREEVRAFASWLDAWSPGSAADHLRSEGDDAKP